MYEKGVKAGMEWVNDRKRFDRRAAKRLSKLRDACKRDEDWDALFLQNANDTQTTGERIFSLMWPTEMNRSTAGEFWVKAGDPNPNPEFVRGFAEAVVEACLDMTA